MGRTGISASCWSRVARTVSRHNRCSMCVYRKRFTSVEWDGLTLLLEVLNALNDSAADGLATDNGFAPNFMQPTVFMDTRRAMMSVRLNFGQ